MDVCINQVLEKRRCETETGTMRVQTQPLPMQQHAVGKSGGTVCLSQCSPSSSVENREIALSSHNANLRLMGGQLTRMGRSVSPGSIRGRRVKMLRWLPKRYEAQEVRDAEAMFTPFSGKAGCRHCLSTLVHGMNCLSHQTSPTKGFQLAQNIFIPREKNQFR